MFYYLEGTVALIEQELAVIDCGGVGYACHTSQNTCGALKQGKKTRLYTYLHIREGACELYGFSEQEELNCFKLLIGVSGVGPKAAISILGIAAPSQLALAIITEDSKFLTRAQGVGKKIAQRICLELKDKMAKEQQSIGASDFAAVTALPVGTAAVNAVNEAVSALMVLGYSQMEAMQAMEGMPTAEITAEELIRACLKKLAVQ